MSDEYDDMPPMDEESDDFKNFDPQAYLAKRGRVRKSLDDEDFSSNMQDISARGTRGSRSSRRRNSSDENNRESDTHIPVGLGAGILGLLEQGNIGILTELLRSFGPLAKILAGIIGCAIVVFCLVVCGGGLLLFNALTRR